MCVFLSVCTFHLLQCSILCLCIQHIWISPRHCCKHWIIKFSVGYTIYVFMYFIAHRISSVVYSLNPNYIKFSVHCVMIALPDGTLCSYQVDIGKRLPPKAWEVLVSSQRIPGPREPCLPAPSLVQFFLFQNQILVSPVPCRHWGQLTHLEMTGS